MALAKLLAGGKRTAFNISQGQMLPCLQSVWPLTEQKKIQQAGKIARPLQMHMLRLLLGQQWGLRAADAQQELRSLLGEQAPAFVRLVGAAALPSEPPPPTRRGALSRAARLCSAVV